MKKALKSLIYSLAGGVFRAEERTIDVKEKQFFQ